MIPDVPPDASYFAEGLVMISTLSITSAGIWLVPSWWDGHPQISAEVIAHCDVAIQVHAYRRYVLHHIHRCTAGGNNIFNAKRFTVDPQPRAGSGARCHCYVIQCFLPVRSLHFPGLYPGRWSYCSYHRRASGQRIRTAQRFYPTTVILSFWLARKQGIFSRLNSRLLWWTHLPPLHPFFFGRGIHPVLDQLHGGIFNGVFLISSPLLCHNRCRWAFACRPPPAPQVPPPGWPVRA